MQNKLSLIPKGKKGNSAGNELLGWIILFGLIGLIGAIFGLIQSEVEDDVVDEMTSVYSASQNLLNVTNAGITLTACSALSGKITSLSAVNSTGGETITSGNYTFNYGCTLTPTGSITYNNTNWNVSYSYNVTESSYAYNNSQKAQEAQGKIFGKLPLVGTIVVLTLILMLVLGVVAYFQNRNAGTGQVS